MEISCVDLHELVDIPQIIITSICLLNQVVLLIINQVSNNHLDEITATYHHITLLLQQYLEKVSLVVVLLEDWTKIQCRIHI